MKLSDLDSIEFRNDGWRGSELRNVGESSTAWRPYGRVIAWARRMLAFRAYGDWTVQETCASAACCGTVRARLSGPRGTVEAWNGNEVFFVPKGVKFSKLPWPDCRAEDMANGVMYWGELPFVADAYEGKNKYYQYARAVRDHFDECVAKACAMAGIQERMDI